jgi:hypothetical protein
MSLCQYRHVFGKEREGVHAYRVFDIAIVDLALTVLAAYLINKRFKTGLVKTLIVLFIVGVVMHRVFCVNTKVDQLLFGTPK